MISRELLQILCCPESHQPLGLADTAIVHKLNEQIAAGRLRNRGGEIVREPLEGGLIRDDRKWLYPVRGTLPIMLIDEAISLEGL